MRTLLLGLLICLLFGCEKNYKESYYIAKIVEYDSICHSCIITFPNDIIRIQKELGESELNYYNAVNLAKDNFMIGQMIYVQVKEASHKVIKPCIELYADDDYKDVFITDYNAYNSLVINDTITINNQECLTSSNKNIQLCMDSLINDSRCPIGKTCIWEGDASVHFHFTKDNVVTSFNLHTNFKYRNDTFINGYFFTLIDVYPDIKIKNELNSYTSKLFIRKL